MTALRFKPLALALLLAGFLAGCEVTPRGYSSNDDCRDCPPGVLSGDDGVITVYGQSDRDEE